MKKTIFLTLVLSLFALLSLKATVWTVSNNPFIPAQYSSMTEAISAATDGDTIYVHGSVTTYGGFSLNKELHFIGAGYNPQKEHPHNSYVGNITLRTGADNSTFTGLSTYQIYSQDVVNNIVIRRCRLRTSYIWVNGTNYRIYNNIIGGYITINSNSDVIIQNNIIPGYIANSDDLSVVIKNNIFLRNGNSFSNIDNAIIANNIFYRSSPLGCEYCSYNNNLTYNTTQNTIPYGTNIGSNNIIDDDPLFVDVTTFNIDLYFDYHLDTDSPGIDAGTDNTNIGIYGGTRPWPDEDVYTGEPNIPQVESFHIFNTVLGVDSFLRFESEAEKKD